nr:BrnT family toxin [uncultured Acetatifactor sp.]
MESRKSIAFRRRGEGYILKFEWDEEKNQINIERHGIDFETAVLVFNDVQRIEIYDIEHSMNEDRYNTIGMVDDVLFVVYTERKENIRLISARVATKTERSIYYDTDSYFR